MNARRLFVTALIAFSVAGCAQSVAAVDGSARVLGAAGAPCIATPQPLWSARPSWGASTPSACILSLEVGGENFSVLAPPGESVEESFTDARLLGFQRPSAHEVALRGTCGGVGALPARFESFTPLPPGTAMNRLVADVSIRTTGVQTRWVLFGRPSP